MISHMYPSPVNPTGGIFVHEQVRALRARGHDVQVVSPKGWAPPGIRRWSGYRDVVPRDTVDDVVVHYPRKVTLPGGRLGHRNADAFLLGIRRTVRRIQREWPIDVMHAHMMVPDGWAAARIGHELGVPAVGTRNWALTDHRISVSALFKRSPVCPSRAARRRQHRQAGTAR